MVVHIGSALMTSVDKFAGEMLLCYRLEFEVVTSGKSALGSMVVFAVFRLADGKEHER